VPAEWRGDRVVFGGAEHPAGAITDRPRDITLGVRPGELRPGAAGIPARVEYIEELGDYSIVDLRAGEQRLKWKFDGVATVREGDEVRLGFEPRAAHIFDRASGERLN
jgi:ABC-type sugar transport system ATPase subunit